MTLRDETGAAVDATVHSENYHPTGAVEQIDADELERYAAEHRE